MPTTVNAPAITVGITVPTTSLPTHVYAGVITVTVTSSPPYISPTPVAPPANSPIAPILLSQTVMPTPTIVNGRPT